MTELERGRAEVTDAQRAAHQADRQADQLVAEVRAATGQLRSLREDHIADKLRQIIRGAA